MKKIVIAFDGKHFSENAFNFAKKLNDIEPILLAGIFLPVVDFTELLYSLGGMGGPVYVPQYEDLDTAVIQKNIDHFTAQCLNNGIGYRVHPDLEKHIVSQVKEESRYADLLVIASELFYENTGDDSQDDYIANVLMKTECPVVLVPEHCQFPDNIILAYDGSESSVYAIKQFAYLLPEYKNKKALLVHACAKESPDMVNMLEWAELHFNSLTVQQLEINPKKYFNTWLEENKNALLVAGAFGRSTVSELFKKSFVYDTLHEYNTPIFIAHK